MYASIGSGSVFMSAKFSFEGFNSTSTIFVFYTKFNEVSLVCISWILHPNLFEFLLDYHQNFSSMTSIFLNNIIKLSIVALNLDCV